MKTRLKEKLEDDEYCAKQLQKLYEKGILFDQLWNEKLCSCVSSIYFI